MMHQQITNQDLTTQHCVSSQELRLYMTHHVNLYVRILLLKIARLNNK
jgi:hypothetical protein